MTPTVFEDLAAQGFKAEAIEDSSREIEALNGKYVARITACDRVTGEKDGPYDFYSLKFTITKTVDGNKGENRRVQAPFGLIDNQWSTADKNLKRFCRTLFTILKRDVGCKVEDIKEACEEIQGMLCRISVWPNKKEGVVQRDGNGWPKHNVMVVKEFKKNGKVIPVELTDTEEAVPF